MAEKVMTEAQKKALELNKQGQKSAAPTTEKKDTDTQKATVSWGTLEYDIWD